MMRRIQGIIVIFVCLVIFTSGCESNDQNEMNSSMISGKILFKEPMSDGKSISGSDFVILDPFYCTVTPVGFQVSRAKFFGSTSKILIQQELGDIELFDIETKDKKVVYNTGSKSSNFSTAYVDDNHFSIADFQNICLVDIQSGKSTVVVEEASGIHSWCDNGRFLYYATSLDATDKKGIYSYEVETGKKTFVINGAAPNISSDGKILAYIKNDVLHVRNMETGKEWKYSNTPLYVCLSPDSKYVAIVEYWSGAWFYDGYTVKIWDYQKDISQTVLPRYANGRCTGIDWVE